MGCLYGLVFFQWCGNLCIYVMLVGFVQLYGGFGGWYVGDFVFCILLLDCYVCLCIVEWVEFYFQFYVGVGGRVYCCLVWGQVSWGCVVGQYLCCVFLVGVDIGVGGQCIDQV